MIVLFYKSFKKIEILNRIRKMIDFEPSHEMTKGITFMEERIEYP